MTNSAEGLETNINDIKYWVVTEDLIHAEKVTYYLKMNAIFCHS